MGNKERIESIVLPFDDGVADDTVLVLLGARLEGWEVDSELDPTAFLTKGVKVHHDVKATLYFDSVTMFKTKISRLEEAYKEIADGE